MHAGPRGESGGGTRAGNGLGGSVMTTTRNSVLAAAVLAAGLAAVGRADDPGANPVSVRQVPPPNILQGQPFTVEVFVTNTGGRPAEDVELIGHWSKSYKLAEADPAAARSLGVQQVWQLGRMAAKETRSLRLVFSPAEQTDGSEFQSSFRVSTRVESNDVKSTPIRRPALELAVTGPAVAVVGQPVRVQLLIRNPDAAEVKGVTVQSKLPPGITHPSGSDLEADVKPLAAGGAETLPLELTPTRAGTVRTVFKVSGTGVPPVEREFTLTAVDAKLEVGLNGPKTLPQNWPGTYEVTVRNAGDQTTPGVQVEVGVPAGFEELRATGGAKFDQAERRLVWAFGDLRAGESRTVVWFGVATRAGDYPVTAAAGPAGAVVKKADWRTQVQPAAGDGR